MRARITFLAFFLRWAELQRWEVPAIHVRACDWLENRGRLAVLRCFRGFGKSTLLAVYNAWRFWGDPAYRILHQGDQDKTAYKTSRDTRAVLMRHPWTREQFAAIRGEVSFWWVPGSVDERNPSMQAAGITSNITSSRCDEAQNDDVEVPRNIQNPEAREKMRYRLGEQTHCMVPGARQLYIGTPHTHDSIYDEQQAMGADCLTIPMYAREHRLENAAHPSYPVPFEPDVVFHGIGKFTRELKRGLDYTIAGGRLRFLRGAPGGLVDLYQGSAWPERFTPAEMVDRRRKCKTVNEWDSQYQLHSKPIHQVRLDPDRMALYDHEPRWDTANKQLRMWLGSARIVGASCRWDPSSAKVGSDVSALAVILQDDRGVRYWHRAVKLDGDVAEFDHTGKTITGGQVWQICNVVEALKLRRVNIETNGVGTFAPAILKAALKQRGLTCGVGDEHEARNKAKAILEAFEPLLATPGMLWAHVSVADGPAFEQMRHWNPALPATAQQPDDYIDAGAKAISDQPERVGGAVRKSDAPPSQDWRPGAGVFEAELTV